MQTCLPYCMMCIGSEPCPGMTLSRLTAILLWCQWRRGVSGTLSQQLSAVMFVRSTCCSQLLLISTSGTLAFLQRLVYEGATTLQSLNDIVSHEIAETTARPPCAALCPSYRAFYQQLVSADTRIVLPRACTPSAAVLQAIVHIMATAA